MVGAAELQELDRLEALVDDGVGDVAKYLGLVRKLKVRRSEKVAKHGMELLNNSKSRKNLGNDVWTVYEQVALAALDCQCLDNAKDCIGALMKKFPESIRVGRLEGMWFEARGSWQQAEKVYASILEEHPTDSRILKRKIAIAKAQGNLLGAIDEMNKYLEMFMADHECWKELADVYISLQMYKQAAFCYEELILVQPANALYHLGYAEILYTIGGLENLRTAKKYYASAIELTGGKNMRALFGVCLCAAGINQVKGRGNKEDKESSALQSLAASVIEKEYRFKAQGPQESYLGLLRAGEMRIELKITALRTL